MTHASLFSGIGGMDLGAEWAGFRTILQVERDPYALRVLEKHWPDVRRIFDVREVTSEKVKSEVTLLSGGFPCQPFSAAGKRGGTEDDRYLWPEMLRVVGELRPKWVVAENVPGLLSIDGGVVFETVLSGLDSEGYETQPIIVPAAGVGAPQSRYRSSWYPSPNATNGKRGSGNPERWTRRHQINLEDVLGGVPSPEFVEWLMGFPIRWTDLKDSGTQ